MQNLTVSDISSIMASGTYGVCYEPIIELKTMEIFSYEALGRFKYKNETITPTVFFKIIHANIDLFFYVESVLKQFQLKHRVIDKNLFLNLDPDTCISEKQINFWIELFEKHKDITIEIIENSDEQNIKGVENFMEWMDTYNIPYACDDFGKPNSIFFFSLLNKSRYIKLDIHFLRTIQKQRSYISVLKGLVSYAKQNHQYTILEGVNSQEDLDVAQEVGVDYIQGHLFKEQFITVWNQ